MKWIQKPAQLTKLDIEGLLRLLDSGFSFQRALFLIENKDNYESIQTIYASLNEGLAVHEFLSNTFPNSLKNYFESFINILSLQDTLRLTITLHEYDKKTKRMLMKSITGPLLMFFGCLIGVELFILIGFPALIKMMDGFGLELDFLVMIQFFLKVGIAFVFLVLFILILVFVYFTNRKRIVLGYVILSKLGFSKLFRHFLSTQFAVYFYECAKMTSSTKNTLEMMKKIHQKPLIVFLTYHVEQQLIQGNGMEKAMSHIYLDPLLGRYMQIAVHSSSAKEMLCNYIEINREKGIELTKRISKTITGFSYLFIGLLIILIYQVLLLPLSMLGQV